MEGARGSVGEKCVDVLCMRGRRVDGGRGGKGCAHLQFSFDDADRVGGLEIDNEELDLTGGRGVVKVRFMGVTCAFTTTGGGEEGGGMENIHLTRQGVGGWVGGGRLEIDNEELHLTKGGEGGKDVLPTREVGRRGVEGRNGGWE